MRPSRGSLAFLAVLIAASPARSQEPVRDAYTTVAVRLRAAPTTSATVLATIPSGTKVLVGSCASGWCLTTYAGITGHVAQAYLTDSAPALPRTAGRGYINSRGEWVPSPQRTPDNKPPPGATAQCRDGTYSFSGSNTLYFNSEWGSPPGPYGYGSAGMGNCGAAQQHAWTVRQGNTTVYAKQTTRLPQAVWEVKQGEWIELVPYAVDLTTESHKPENVLPPGSYSFIAGGGALGNGEMVVRVLVAVALGGLIGIDREIDGQAAGFRTHVLVCLGAALFNAAGEWLKRFGARAMRGPMNPSTNYECGVLIEGFDSDPMVMMPYNPRYYPELIEKCGLQKVMDLYAFYV